MLIGLKGPARYVWSTNSCLKAAQSIRIIKQIPKVVKKCAKISHDLNLLLAAVSSIES